MAIVSPKRTRKGQPQTSKPPVTQEPNIWAIPPLATKGSVSPETVFAAVGYALTCWELFETSLAILFYAHRCKWTNRPPPYVLTEQLGPLRANAS